MKHGRLFLLTVTALAAFAANSILCRFALGHTAIDPASFTLLRILSGAILLAAIAFIRKGKKESHGGWLAATALFVYAAAFSFAYTQLPAGTGALLLFGAVQATMIVWGVIQGERLHAAGLSGLVLALAGLVALTWPGVATPPVVASASMLAAGIAWGIYSLRGRSIANPLESTAANFLRAVPMAIVLSLALHSRLNPDRTGIILALISGAITSGLGYVIWYAVVPDLGAIRASIVQLCVPVLAAAAGIVFLNESLSFRLALATGAILGGVGLVILRKAGRNLTGRPTGPLLR
jgi:drug/metabolite transporter (DMT)-like permease